MPHAQVVLATMPWANPATPSIQLGVLKALAENAGIECATLHLNLRFLEYLVASSAGRPRLQQFCSTIFGEIGDMHASSGLGEWIFAVPPFSEPNTARDEELWAHLEPEVPGAILECASSIRELVPDFLSACAQEILAFSPRVVGFTTMFVQNIPSLALARVIKSLDSSVQIIFGGANCAGPMGAALHRSYPFLDVVVRGEAERVFPGVLRDLVDGNPVRTRPGLCYRQGGRSVVAPEERSAVQMDEVPLPNYDDYFAQLEGSSLRKRVAPSVRLPMETARGCWWGAKQHCTFCGLNGESMVFRALEPRKAFERLMTLASKYEALSFSVVDNIMALEHVRVLLPMLHEAGVDISLFYETKANLKKAQLRLFRDAGVRVVQPGIESLSTRILALMRKGITALENIRFLKWCDELGIFPRWNLIYGFPGEDAADYALMAETIPSLVHLPPPNWVRLHLDRFSPYHDQPRAFGIQAVGPLPFYKLLYDVDPSTASEIACSFVFDYEDGRDPESYSAPVRTAIESWSAPENRRTLTYRRGPGFIIIDDRRSTTSPARFTLTGSEALIYEACDGGARPERLVELLGRSGHAASRDGVLGFLAELVTARLAYTENGRYLSLALGKDHRKAALPDADTSDRDEHEEPRNGLLRLRRAGA